MLQFHSDAENLVDNLNEDQGVIAVIYEAEFGPDFRGMDPSLQLTCR